MTVKVEVFTAPGCSKCGQAKVVLQRVAEALGGVEWKEVNVLEDLDRAVALGVLSTPAIAIDGELVYTGLPSAARLRAELERRLAAGGTPAAEG